jgi:methionyl-tRNA formyltransferase
MGDLNKMDLDSLAPALRSDYYVVFGASYVKGPLVDVLVENSCLNCHLGVSPYYRGASCNFWALADGRPDMVGGTVHLLTKGLDSGPMLYHAKPKPGAYDAFEFGMRAVEAVQRSVCDRIADGSIHAYTPMAQDKGREMRYSRYTDFTDEVAAKFLADPPSSESIRASLEQQDERLFSNLYT